jgi:hypothetical protein
MTPMGRAILITMLITAAAGGALCALLERRCATCIALQLLQECK